MLRPLLSRLLAILLALAPAQAQEFFPSHGPMLASSSGAAAAPANAFIGCTNDDTGLTTYTFAAQSLGTAHATRTIIVGAAGWDTVSDFSVASATIDGISATIAVNTATTSIRNVAFFSAAVPSNATGDIAVTYSEAVSQSAICVWAAYGVSATASTTASDTDSGTNALTLSLNVASGEVAVGMCIQDTGQSFTWSGLTESSDTSGAETTVGSAWNSAGATGTPLAVTCTPTSASAATAGASASYGTGVTCSDDTTAPSVLIGAGGGQSGTGTKASETISNFNSVTGDEPAVGDVILIVAEMGTADSITIAGTAGFTQLGSNVTGAASRLQVFWTRVDDVAETVSWADPGDHWVINYVFLRGVDSAMANPFDVTSTGTQASTTSGSIAGLTTTCPNTRVVGVITTGDDASSTTEFSAWLDASLASVAEITSAGATTSCDRKVNSGGGGGVGCGSGTKAAAGTVNAMTVTLATASATATMMIAVKGQ